MVRRGLSRPSLRDGIGVGDKVSFYDFYMYSPMGAPTRKKWGGGYRKIVRYTLGTVHKLYAHAWVCEHDPLRLSRALNKMQRVLRVPKGLRGSSNESGERTFCVY